jgi:hypothetical protein
MAKRIVLIRNYLGNEGLTFAAPVASFRFYPKLGKTKTLEHRINVEASAWLRQPNGSCY